MSRLLKALVIMMVVVAILAVSLALYVRQYDNLSVDVDAQQSSHSFPIGDTVELDLVLVLTNTGDVELYVPPTTFDLSVDGVDA